MTDNLDLLRHIEGFPLGKDEDLHSLSNPPYYTAYPNPHIADFIEEYGKPYDEVTDDYHREPYVTDISEGKNDPIYRAHSYHTKVPYKAIIPFIEHYAEAGGVVLDGFSGSGMTGLAAQATGRHAILCDLAPAATFIASNLNRIPTIKINQFINEAKSLLKDSIQECEWMFKTKHVVGEASGNINYTIWSEVFECPYCKKEIVFAEIGYDLENDTDIENPICKFCKADLTKNEMIRKIDDNGKTKIVPVLIDYSVGKKRFKKKPDQNDLDLLNQVNRLNIPYWYPNELMMFKTGNWGQYWRSGYHTGYERISDFYTKRSLWSLAYMWKRADESSDPRSMRFLLTSFVAMRCSLRMPYRAGGRSAGAINNLHIPSLIQEYNPLGVLARKTADFLRAIETKPTPSPFAITTQSVCDLKQIPDNSIDYIFVDPPFGDNIIYGELNFLWEAWLKVYTNLQTEAIVSKYYDKEESKYRDLMLRSFTEMYRVIKPGRWITVEFHNSKASIWNIIQDSLARSGFLVAQVTILDKQQGSYKQVSTPGSVKNDLVINAYKPRLSIINRLISQAGRGLEMDFVREHLRQLPIAANVERSKEMLYSKYLAYYVQHGYQVAYNGEQFYRALSQWGLEERDGYWFADEAQAHEYEQRKLKTFGKKGVQPQAVLFVSDERSARQWIWNFLDEPKTYDEIYTKFVPALQTSEDEIPELMTMLEESFVRTNGHWKRPDQLTQTELEQKRLERLLRQFNEYLEAAQSGHKVNEVRREAVLAGFTECYREGRFQDIITLGRKLDKRLLDESPDIFDFVDIAEAKIES